MASTIAEIVTTITNSRIVYPSRRNLRMLQCRGVRVLKWYRRAAPIAFFTRPAMRNTLLVATTAFLLSSCRDPRAEANIAQAMTDVGTQLSAMQQDYAVLQGQVDSLRGVVARQDTIIGRLASMAGLPIAPR